NDRYNDHGLTTKSIITARVGIPSVYTDTAKQKQFFADAVQRVSALPGVQAATVSSGLPGARQGLGGQSFALEGKSYTRDQDYPNARWLSVTPGFLATLNVPVVTGRGFTDADREGALPVAIVNKAFAAKYFPGSDPVGRRIRLGQSKSKAPWLSIVGVVADVFGGNNNFNGETDSKPPIILQPF